MLKMALKWGFGSISCFWGLKAVLKKTEDVNSHLIDVVVRVALIFSMFNTVPIQKGIVFLATYLPIEDINSFLGPRVLFEVNPYHPKHLLSFFSLALNIQLLFYLVFFKQKAFTEEKSVLLFQIFASRPVLHLLNQGLFFL